MFNSLIIKSRISGTYKVDFITDLNKQLSQINDNKSIFIIDKNVLNLFPESFKLIKSSSRLVIIESGERSKTIEYCQFVIKNLIELHVRKDDKLIAIAENSSLSSINSMEELNEKNNGISKILEIWFSNYKGSNKVISKGYGDQKEALIILNASIKEYKALIK